jgi:hypothetical protein
MELKMQVAEGEMVRKQREAEFYANGRSARVTI